MKKVILAATLIFALYTTASADSHVDYVRKDGSATRVTYTQDRSGNTTVTRSQVSREQRESEQKWELVKAVAVLILKALFGGGGR